MGARESLADGSALDPWLAAGCRFGEIRIRQIETGYDLRHCADEFVPEADLALYREIADATLLARFDSAGKFRPLKTAPNLRRGWRLIAPDAAAVQRACELFYPGRLTVYTAFRAGALRTTPLRETLNRQTGMYRIAAKVSDTEIDGLVGRFCRSEGGCLRTILWRRDAAGTLPSSVLPPEKFYPAHDQKSGGGNPVPLLCQEACNLVIAGAREAVKSRAEPAAAARP